jgi:hypothetical protein
MKTTGWILIAGIIGIRFKAVQFVAWISTEILKQKDLR